MKGKKRFLPVLLAVAMAAGLLAGCSGQKNMIYESEEEGAGPQVSLTFFGFKEEALNVIAIEEALHSYMDLYPEVSISYDGIKSPNYFDVLEKRIATGNEDDIIMVDHQRVLELGRQGKLADLSELSTLEDFSELAESQMWATGELLYVPTSISAFGLYCNRDLLKAHGQKIPEDLEEFRAVCDYFVSAGITPIVANNDISLKTVAIAKAMLPVYQSEDTDGEFRRFNSGEADLAEAFRPGFELVEEMLKRGWVDAQEAGVTAKTKDDLALFAKGERPFMLTGAWAVPRLRELAPEFDFEVRPYPLLEDGSVLVINVDTRVSVSAASPHVEEAKRFVEYLTQKDVMWKFVESQSSFSPLKENRLSGDRAVQAIGPYLTNGRSVLGSDDNLQFPIWDITRKCVVEMLEGGNAQSAVQSMREQMEVWKAAGMGGGAQ